MLFPWVFELYLRYKGEMVSADLNHRWGLCKMEEHRSQTTPNTRFTRQEVNRQPSLRTCGSHLSAWHTPHCHLHSAGFLSFLFQPLLRASRGSPLKQKQLRENSSQNSSVLHFSQEYKVWVKVFFLFIFFFCMTSAVTQAYKTACIQTTCAYAGPWRRIQQNERRWL